MNINNLIVAIFALVFYLVFGLYVWKTDNRIKAKIVVKKSRQKKVIWFYFILLIALIYGVFNVIFSN